MNDLLKAYDTIIKSNLDQVSKVTTLISTLVSEELIENEFHKEHMISICQSNLVALNNSLIDNQMLYSVLNGEDNKILQDIIVSYIKNKEQLINQLDESKLLFDSICKKKFNNELKSEVIKRKQQ